MGVFACAFFFTRCCMATKKQIEANRRNSLKSSGPRTPEGQAKVSLNHLSHGLCGAFRVLAHESQEAFENLLARLTADQRPVGDLEAELVRKMAEAMWMRKRAVDLQGTAFNTVRDLPYLESNQVEVQIHEKLEKLLRYEAHHDRVFRRAL